MFGVRGYGNLLANNQWGNSFKVLGFLFGTIWNLAGVLACFIGQLHFNIYVETSLRVGFPEVLSSVL